LDVRMYPNPTTNGQSTQVRFDKNLQNENKDIRLIAADGRVVQLQSTREDAAVISTTGLSKGCYWVQVLTNRGTWVRKLVVQ
ncbi:MAG: T9SS type A sorting domain-containing protein, partial [Bacteroidota bacterium]